MSRIPIFRLFSGVSLALSVSLAAACDRGGEGGDESIAFALGEARELPSPAGVGSAEPNLAVGPDGRVYLSWVEPGPDSTHALKFAELQGDRWSAPRTVASGGDWFVNWADFPSLVALPGGRLAAHWLQKSGSGKYAYDVRIAQSADGGRTWSPGVVPHRDGLAAEHGFVSMWAAPGDSLAAVWLDGRKYVAGEGGGAPTEEMMLMSATLASDGTLGPERPLDPRICDCCQTSMAVTADGPVVVYRDRTEDEIRDIYVVRQVNGAWTEPKPVHADGWKIPACPVNGPSVSADGRRVAVAWFTGARDTARVRVAFSDDAGATFSAPVRVDGGGAAGRVDVELVEGGALVSWIERTGGDTAEVRVRHVAQGGALGEPRAIATSSAERASGFPRMARAGSDVVFAWTAPGAPTSVKVARASLARAQAPRRSRSLAGPVVGEPAPAYAARTADGNPISLADLRGQTVLLNVWATWCHPCRDELPDLQRLHEANAARGLRIVGVSVDAAGQEAEVVAFAREYGVTYDVWLDPKESVSSTFRTIGVPSTFLIAPDGTLLWRHVGPVKADDPELTRLLGQTLKS